MLARGQSVSIALGVQEVLGYYEKSLLLSGRVHLTDLIQFNRPDTRSVLLQVIDGQADRLDTG